MSFFPSVLISDLGHFPLILIVQDDVNVGILPKSQAEEALKSTYFVIKTQHSQLNLTKKLNSKTIINFLSKLNLTLDWPSDSTTRLDFFSKNRVRFWEEVHIFVENLYNMTFWCISHYFRFGWFLLAKILRSEWIWKYVLLLPQTKWKKVFCHKRT